MNLPRIRTRKNKESTRRLLLNLGERAFLIFLGLLVIALIFGAIIYYQYNILAKKEESQVLKEPFQFQEETYQNVFRIWQEREKKFEEADLKEHPNPFKVEQFKEAILEDPSGSSGVAQEETGLEESPDSSNVDQE